MNTRLRVDVGQTGFFTGREFRTFRELNISSGQTLTVKAVVPVNVILFDLSFDIVSGRLRVETVAGGTPGGDFNETLPIFNRNNTTEVPFPKPVPQTVLTAGGTLAGGTVLDLVLIQAGSNQGNQRSTTIGGSQGDERGIGPGTYHFRLSATVETVVGVMHSRWEERP